MKKAKEKTTLFRDLDTVDNVIKLYQSMKMNYQYLLGFRQLSRHLDMLLHRPA